jgi:feruloyl esterase
VLLFLVSRVDAQNGSQFKDWTPPVGEHSLEPKASCASLLGLTNYEFSIVSAVEISATSEAPEHCRVQGQISPEIRFEVDLPSRWNRRLYMFGNGGFAGEPLDYPLHVEQTKIALKRAFAVAFTNTGHDKNAEPFATFASNPQKLIDFAFRSIHLTALTAKLLIRTYYGEPQVHSYFEGCSTGGRQGLMSAQRFPADFDGIIIGAPMLDYVGTMISSVWIDRALKSAPIPSAKLKVLADRIYERCDAIDGLKDGLIDDPRNCDFRPSHDLPLCQNSHDDASCFTLPQATALEKVYSDVLSRGRSLFPGWPVSGEIDGPNWFSESGHGPGWVPMLINDDGTSWATAFTESFFQYIAFPDAQHKYELSSFDFDKDPARLEAIRRMMDAADPDLTSFQSRGGKILMYWGWGDPALNPKMGTMYYERVSQKMGAKTDAFFKLFMVPGMFHCGAGVGTSDFDVMTPAIQWVESGKPPNRVIGSASANGKVMRTRPLCPYPQVARYTGSGSIDDAANFTCRVP